MAGKVRRVLDGTDEFDLAGYSREKCQELARLAFADPFELPGNMVKITFVVGAGKLGRQKYGDDLVRNFCEALNDVGFDSDNAACIELASAGKYKYQHDTGKNLLFVHVFPKYVAPAGDEEEEGEEGEEEGGQRNPADVLCIVELPDFQRMVGSNVVSYSDKRQLLAILREKLVKLDEAEQKLIARQELDKDLQKLYDTLSVDGLKEKVKVMAGEMQANIEAGELTSGERSQALEQLDGKLEALEGELAKAAADGKAKLQTKLEEQKEKIKEQKQKISEIKPVPLADLKYAAEIQRLHKRIAGLVKLEKESGGKYTLDQLKALGEKPEMEEAVSVLEARSRTWFESDEEFKARLKYCLSQAPAPKKKPTAGYAAGNSSSAWSTVKKR